MTGQTVNVPGRLAWTVPAPVPTKKPTVMRDSAVPRVLMNHCRAAVTEKGAAAPRWAGVRHRILLDGPPSEELARAVWRALDSRVRATRLVDTGGREGVQHTKPERSQPDESEEHLSSGPSTSDDPKEHSEKHQRGRDRQTAAKAVLEPPCKRLRDGARLLAGSGQPLRFCQLVAGTVQGGKNMRSNQLWQ